MIDHRISQRLSLFLFLQNLLVFFFILTTLAFYGFMGFLAYWIAGWFLEIPMDIWIKAIFLFILTDLARYLANQTLVKKKFTEFTSLIMEIFWFFSGIFLLLLAHAWLLYRKFIFLNQEKKNFTIQILDYLFRQKVPVRMEELTSIMYDWVKREQAEIKKETKEINIVDVAKDMVEPVQALFRLKFVEYTFQQEEEKRFLLLKLTSRGESFMMGFQVDENKKEN